MIDYTINHAVKKGCLAPKLSRAVTKPLRDAE